VKPVIIIGIGVIGFVIGISAGLMISSETMSGVESWSVMNCNGMLDFSGTEEHDWMGDAMHIEFHEYFLDNCSDMKMEEPTNMISEECSGTARCITGKVTKIVDGDTIHVDGVSIRFAMASAPEPSVYGGVESTEFIQTICPVGSDVIVDEDDSQTEGSFGRMVGVVYCNGVNLNSELLDAGLGYLADQFCDSSEFANDPWAQKHGC